MEDYIQKVGLQSGIVPLFHPDKLQDGELPPLELFKGFEQTLRKIWKMVEKAPLYLPNIRKSMTLLDMSYKVMKLVYDSAAMRKWSRLELSIQKTLKGDPDLLPFFENSPVLLVFKNQRMLISTLNNLLIKEEVDFEDISKIPKITSKLLTLKLGDINIEELSSDCFVLSRLVDRLRSSSSGKVDYREYQAGHVKLNNFALTLTDKAIDEFNGYQDNLELIHELLGRVKHRGAKLNGYLVDHLQGFYNKSQL